MIAPSLKEPCTGADIAAVKTVNDIAAFGLADDAALQMCEAKRHALVDLAESAGNEKVKKK